MINLRKTFKPGACAANRCTAEPYVRMADGIELCVKHAPAYKPTCDGEQTPPTGEPPASMTAASTLAIPARADLVQTQEDAAVAFKDRVTPKLPAKITSDKQMQAIGALAAHAQGKIGELEKDRKAAIADALSLQRRINGWFKPAVAAYEAVKEQCHDLMTGYRREQAAARQAALDSGDHETAMATRPAELPAGTHARSNGWGFKVVDASAVPREFLCVDSARVQAVVDAQRERTSIPGIDVFEHEATLVTRGAK